MIFKSVSYQEKAIKELFNFTEKLLDNGGKNSLIIFKSPTGSGKTVMMAQYIKRTSQEIEDDFCFVWISVGKGELHLQSKNKLESLLEGTLEVSLLDEEYFGSKKEISKNEVVVVNWEKIRGKDSKTNEWKNILMKDGERLNFRDVLFNTHYIGRKIILIIDESHIGQGSQRTEEIKNEVDAELLIEMTATPKIPSTFNDDLIDGKAGYVKVDIQDVIDAEMIKKNLIMNEGLKNKDNLIIDEELLELALNKRKVLKKMHEDEGSKVNPLVLIQLPNSSEGDSKKEFICQKLKDQGITIENRKLAIWLDNEKTNLESISNNSDSVEFLIFKQAIDTGWDCPRTQILLKYRATSSETFERQTLGRILRMPEQKHYKQDELNKAYVFTDYLGKILDIIDEDFDYPDGLMNDITILAKKELANITLRSEKINKKKKDVVKEAISKSFDIVISQKGLKKLDYKNNQEKLELDLNLSNLNEKIIGEVEITTQDILQKEQITGEEVTIFLDEFRTQTLFEKILKMYAHSIGNDQHKMFNILKDNMYSLLSYYVVDVYSLPNILVDVQRLFILNHQEVFSKIIHDVFATYKTINIDELVEMVIEQNEIFTIPQIETVNSKTYVKLDLKKYFYEECYLYKDRSSIEIKMEKYIQDNLDKIDYWVKNGDNGSQYFSITYDVNGNSRSFYPDFIIKFSDGKIGLFETKDKNDNSRETTAKAESLHKYIEVENESEKKLIGGIVSDFGSVDTPYLKINSNEKFSTNESEWIDLEKLY